MSPLDYLNRLPDPSNTTSTSTNTSVDAAAAAAQEEAHPVGAATTVAEEEEQQVADASDVTARYEVKGYIPTQTLWNNLFWITLAGLLRRCACML